MKNTTISTTSDTYAYCSERFITYGKYWLIILHCEGMLCVVYEMYCVRDFTIDVLTFTQFLIDKFTCFLSHLAPPPRTFLVKDFTIEMI